MAGRTVARMVLAVVVLAVAAGVAVPATATDAGVTAQAVATDAGVTAPATASTAADGNGTIRVEYAVDRTPNERGQITIRQTVTHVPERVTELVLYLNNSYRDVREVRRVDGFDYDRTRGHWRWDGTTARPTMTYVVGVNTTDWFGQDAVDTIDFTFAADVTAGHTWNTDGTGSATLTERVEPVGPGYVGDQYVFLGPHRVLTANASRESFVLVVPDAASPQVPPDDALDALVDASEDFDVGGRSDTVTAFVLPPPIRGGGQARFDSFWYGQGADAELILHEYVHTRQSFVPGPDMEWFVEASGEYYGHALAWRHAGTSDARFRRSIEARTHRDATLVDADWTSVEDENYEKGAHVLAALDVAIRNRTDGRHSLDDVFRRINGRRGLVGYRGFRRAVDGVASESMGDWLDRYLRASALPALPPAQTVRAAYHPDTHGVVRVDVTDGAGPVRGADVTLRNESGHGETVTTDENGSVGVGRRAGTYTLEVRAGGRDTVERSVRVTAGNRTRVTVRLYDRPPAIVGGVRPTDPDDDGVFEDVDGDGRVTLADAVGLFAHRGDPAVTAHAVRFDLTGDGRVSLLDVQALYRLTR